MDWQGGAIEQELGGVQVVRLRLMPAGGHGANQGDVRAISGDKEFSSGHAAMQQLNPTVYQMIVNLTRR